MSHEGCIFCGMVEGKVPVAKVYEDDFVLAFLDISPLSDGHTLVVPKQHRERLHCCSPDVLRRLGDAVGKVAKAVIAAMKCDGYNVLCNNGVVAGQLVEHVHFHIIPRNKGDNIFNQWPAKKYPEGKIHEIAEIIHKNL